MNESELFDGYTTRELQEKQKLAELGYLSMPLLEPLKGAFWGEFNDRPLKSKAINDLVMAFNGHIDNCTDNTAIGVVVRKLWLEERVGLGFEGEG